MTKTWIDSERQGRGRRFWFRTRKACAAFERVRRARGYHVISEEHGDTCWVSFARTMNDDIRKQQHGLDT